MTPRAIRCESTPARCDPRGLPPTTETVIRISCLADVLAEESRPLSTRYAYETTSEIFADVGERFGDRPALTFIPGPGLAGEARTLTYRELVASIRRCARVFQDLGATADRGVALILPNLPESHICLWAAEVVSFAAPLNAGLGGKHAASLVSSAGCSIVVGVAREVDEALHEVARSAAETAGARLVVVGGSGGPGEIDLSQAMDQQSDAPLAASAKRSDLASYFHTGGTTALPKLAAHTHENEVYMAWILSEIFALSESDVFLVGLPLFHVNAAILCGLAAFRAGAEVVLVGPAGFREPKVIADFWRIVERYRVTVFSGVPAIYAALLDVPKDGADVSTLRYGICGAAPIARETFLRFEDITGIRIIEGYGLTEGALGSAVNPPFGERKVGSVGLRFPYQEVQILEVDAAGERVRELPAGEVGAVCVRGPNVFPGYKLAEHNEKIWPEPGLFNTGDLGYVDDDGFLWLVGRAKDIIIRGGHNIDPKSIEEAMAAHPAVAMVAAVGRSHPRLGEVPVVVVEARPGQQPVAAELLAWAEANIAERQAMPVACHVVDKLPLTNVGKLDKRAIRRFVEEQHLRAALAEVDGAANPEALTIEANARGQLVVNAARAGLNAAGRDLLSALSFELELD